VAHDDGKTPEAHMAMKRRMPGGERKTITSLAVLARNGFQPWPTPTARDYKDTGDLSRVPENSLLPRVVQRLERERWPTPRTSDAKGAGHHGTGGLDLRTAVAEHWPTPQARDGQGRSTPMPEVAAQRFAEGRRNLEDAVSLNGSPGGMLNPSWVEWLMGFPPGWTDV
jgi:hypothetical protein